MDPEACVRRVLAACGDGKRPADIDEFVEACEDLAGWLARGGFVPSNIKAIQSSMLLLLRLHNRDAAKVIEKAQG